MTVNVSASATTICSANTPANYKICNKNRCGHQLLDKRSLQYYLQTAIRLNNVSIQQLCCTNNLNTNSISGKLMCYAIDAIKKVASSDEINCPTYLQLDEMEKRLYCAKDVLFNGYNNENTNAKSEGNKYNILEISFTSNSSINSIKSFFTSYETNHSNNNINNETLRYYLSISENDVSFDINGFNDEISGNDQLNFVSTIMLYNLGAMYVARAEATFSESSSTLLCSSSIEAMLDGSKRLFSLSLQVLDAQIASKFSDQEYENYNNATE